MAALLDGAVSAGFIAPQNLSLLKIVNLEGGDAANADETRVEEWGPAVLKALKEWSLPVSLSTDISRLMSEWEEG